MSPTSNHGNESFLQDNFFVNSHSIYEASVIIIVSGVTMTHNFVTSLHQIYNNRMIICEQL